MPASALKLPASQRPAKPTPWLKVRELSATVRAFPDGSLLARWTLKDGRPEPAACAFEVQEASFAAEDAATLQAVVGTLHRAGYLEFQLEATPLHPGRWAVRPQGQLGTCGYYPVAWTVHYVNARTAADAVAKARRQGA